MAEAIATAAAGWAVSVAGWVASPIVSRLLNEGFSYLGDTSIKDRLENLETTILPQFQLVIEAAEKSNEDHKTKLKLWLRKLKEAMYEAEETLDLYKYQLPEKKVNDLNYASTSKSLVKYVGKVKKGLSSTLSSQNKNKLRDSLIKLEKIAAEAQSYYQLFLGGPSGSSMTNNTTIGGPRKITASLVPSKVFGRDSDRDEIINKYLLDQSEACESEVGTVERRSYSVVTIVGIGGAGKTTLARYIYNDQRMIDGFDIKMWVCMSRKLDLVKLTKEMIISASEDNGCPNHENLDVLQRKLKDLIGSKKILLVLDDIWCYKSENEAEWEEYLAPLADAGEGSKILVTTRPENMRNMPIVLHSENTIKLNDLGENQLISLFMSYAFSRETKLSDTRQNLVEIGKQIVQKLSSSPLAARVVGSHLSKRLEINFWKATLEKDNLTDTREALIWSYHRLDAHLKRCFSYFSLFPKGHWFIAEKMVHLWMAEGFISTSNDSRRMEDIGMDYWDELVSGSFLQFEIECGTKYYSTHDLFHDLAERVSEEDCFRIEDDQVKEIPRSIRHLGISSETIGKGSIMAFQKLENLRTLLMFVSKGNHYRDPQLSNNDRDLLIAAIEKFEKLRVLILSSFTIKSLPKYIGDLKHLRYLDISKTDVAELPLSLGKLHHLQVLDLTCPIISSLPRSLKNLSNLRHLKSQYTILSTLPDIGKLTYLQGLENFEVKKEKGCNIGQLKNLNELRGSLTISQLENVEGKDQVIEASLKDKKHLDSLCLMWSCPREIGSNTHLDMEVVEGLQPPLNLTKLKISHCKSLRCPSWLMREGCLENLRSLYLQSTSFEDLPTISKLFPHCQELSIWNLPKLRTLPFLPQSLEKLVLVACPLLVFVSEEELQNSAERKKSIMTIVQSYQLEVRRDSLAREDLDVKKLMESEKIDIPEDFQTFAATQVDGLNLREAYRRCQEQRLAAIFARKNKSELFLPLALQKLVIGSTNITDGALSLCLGGLTSLKSLRLYEIETITIVPTNHLVSLCDLTILDCHCLKSLGALHLLVSLEELWIDGCPCLELEMMESDGRIILPHSLQSLEVRNNTNTKRFAIGDLPGLISVKLTNLPLLESLSLSGLTALMILAIWNCPELSGLDCSQALNSSFELTIRNVPKLASASLSEAVQLYTLHIDSDATLGVLLSSSSECLAALSKLDLYSCAEASFHEEHFSCLASLVELNLSDCQVQSLPRSLKNLSSLKTLCLNSCPHISSLSSNLPESLKDLTLRACKGISSLTMRLPESLERIRISGCPVLKKRCREGKGEDWPKIAHIPIRRIE